MPRFARVVLIIVGAVAVLYLLFTVVFPWVEARMEDPAMETGSQQLVRSDTGTTGGA